MEGRKIATRTADVVTSHFATVNNVLDNITAIYLLHFLTWMATGVILNEYAATIFAVARQDGSRLRIRRMDCVL
jgi:hypothetical protein